MVSHHPAKFGGHGHFDSGNITVLVCHVILQGNVIKELSLYGLEPFVVNHHPSKFGGHGYYGSGDMMVSFCHINLGDDLTKDLGNFMDKNLTR